MTRAMLREAFRALVATRPSAWNEGETVMTEEVVFLFDVDNTLLDNDRFQRELREHLSSSYGDHACGRYWAIFGELWSELGYADYLGAVERYRLENPHSPPILRMANWI